MPIKSEQNIINTTINACIYCCICIFACFQIELIDRVDDIYRNTSWTDEFKGYGVQIQQVGVAGCPFDSAATVRTVVGGGVVLQAAAVPPWVWEQQLHEEL